MDEPVAASSDSDADDTLNAPTEAGSPRSGSNSHADLDAPTEHPGGNTSAPGPGPGQVIDEYELIREIARGGMGVVYLAKQTTLNRFVALKMLLDSDSASGEELQRFANEARAAGALDHPGIVPVYEVGSHGGRPYFSMAYVDGKSLSAMINEGPLVPEHAALIAKEVSIALAHAHEQQIIHRDIKPANILIDGDGSPRVTDFGVSKSLASHSQLTSHGELIGTPHFMPPEQAGTPDAVVGPASDVYSIGAVLYACITAKPPFQAPSPIDVVAQVMTQDPVPPSKFFSGIPDDLETITMKCLAKHPRDRYPTAQALADDLNRFLLGEPIEAKPPGIFKRLQHAARRHIFLASVSGSFALLLVFLTVLITAALIQARTQIAELRQLLDDERKTARSFAKAGQEELSGEHDYEIQRLTDAATRLLDKDPQLAIHLAVHAGDIAERHRVAVPADLRSVLMKITAAKPESNPDLPRLLESARGKLDRELTEFELAVYGLLDPSHKIGTDEAPPEASGDPEKGP